MSTNRGTAPAAAAGWSDVSWLASAFEHERRRLFRIARLLIGSDEIAEEVVQEAFLRVHASGRRPDNAAAYLRTTVVNLSRNHLRRRSIERRTPVPPAAVLVNPEVDETWAALARLPFRQRAALVLRYYQDLSEAEIAETLGCPVGSVKSSLHRGLAKLRKELSP